MSDATAKRWVAILAVGYVLFMAGMAVAGHGPPWLRLWMDQEYETARDQAASSDQNQNTQAPLEASKNGPGRDRLVSTVSNNGDPPLAQPEARGPTEHEEHDLKAQQQMARWAFWMIIVTGTSVGVTAAGVWVVYKTLEETTELRVQAQRTTQAALGTVDVTREIGKKQIRAYLTIRKIEVEKFEVSSPVCASAHIENAGQTPAHDVSVVLSLPFGFADKPERLALAVDGRLIRQMKYPIAPGGAAKVLCSYTGQLIPAWFEKFKDGSGEQYFVVIVSYRDVFGCKHGTTYKGILNAKSLKDGAPFFQICEKGNRAT